MLRVTCCMYLCILNCGIKITINESIYSVYKPGMQLAIFTAVMGAGEVWCVCLQDKNQVRSGPWAKKREKHWCKQQFCYLEKVFSPSCSTKSNTMFKPPAQLFALFSVNGLSYFYSYLVGHGSLFIYLIGIAETCNWAPDKHWASCTNVC